MNYSMQDHVAPAAHGMQRSFIRRRASLLVGTTAALAGMAMFVQYRSRQAEQANPP
ncbi:MAG: hypothetical protein JWQ23_741, partial [Herminiimonas sp.]|nr:hypothetical protein [Herminiimonas sp.]